MSQNKEFKQITLGENRGYKPNSLGYKLALVLSICRQAKIYISIMPSLAVMILEILYGSKMIENFI